MLRKYAIWKPIKNFNKRTQPITACIIHYMSAIYVDKNKLYDINLNFNILENNKVSAHYIIDRDGVIYQLVSESDKAWHAGESKLDGEYNCNAFSIGIELLATYTSGFTDKQYESVIKLCQDIKKDYNIPDTRFKGHEHICTPPGRKIDPGPEFKWDRFFAGLNNQPFPPKAKEPETNINTIPSSINKDGVKDASTTPIFQRIKDAVSHIFSKK